MMGVLGGVVLESICALHTLWKWVWREAGLQEGSPVREASMLDDLQSHS